MRACALAALLAVSGTGAVSAQEAFSQSPITPGLWAWPGKKDLGRDAVADLCREKLAIQFSDGRYLGVKLRSKGQTLARPVIDEVGQCRFNRETQIERCDLKQFGGEEPLTGFIESRFSYDAARRLKMSVTSTVTSGERKDPEYFDLYPVPCPDGLTWDVLAPTEDKK